MPTPPTPSSSAAWSRRPSATDYTRAISSASRLIAEAAQHQPADGNALGALNQALVAYTSQVEQARANNRQALPIGAQYLKEASADLRATALPLLKNLGEANNARVAEEFDRAARAALWLVVPGLLTLVVLGLALVWLARRTRRYVNLPLAAAALVVLVTLVVGTVGLLAVKEGVDTTRDGVYAATLSTAQARIAGFDAKSNESLTLIARGSGAAFEKAWQASNAAVRAELAELGQNPASSGLSPLPWSEYAAVHQQIRALDDGGNWDGAVDARDGHGARHGQRHLRRVRHQLGRAAVRPERPDLAAARRRRRLVAGGRCARLLAGVVAAALRLVGRLAAAGGVPMSRRQRRTLAILTVLAASLGVGGLHDGRRLRPDPLCTPRLAGTVAERVAVAQRVTVAVARRPRAPTSSSTNCLQSYAPPATLPAPGPDAVGQPHAHGSRTVAASSPGVSADTLLLGARNPVTERDRGLRHRHAPRGLPGHLRRPEQDRATGSSPSAQREPAPPGRQRRHRGPQHDDQLRPLEEDRLLQRVLPRRARRSWCRNGAKTESGGPITGIEDLAGKKVCAPDRVHEHDQAADLRGRPGRRGRHAHRLPGAVPAGRGRRHHR